MSLVEACGSLWRPETTRWAWSWVSVRKVVHDLNKGMYSVIAKSHRKSVSFRRKVNTLLALVTFVKG
jgi:hypothetical protein